MYEPAWSNSLWSFQRAQSGKGAMDQDEMRDQGPAVLAHVLTRCAVAAAAGIPSEHV